MAIVKATTSASAIHHRLIRLHGSCNCNLASCANMVSDIARSSASEDFPFTCKFEGCLAMVIDEDHALQALEPTPCAPFARTRNRYLCSSTRFGTSKLHSQHVPTIVSTDSSPRLLNKGGMWKMIVYCSYKQQYKHDVCKNAVLEKSSIQDT